MRLFSITVTAMVINHIFFHTYRYILTCSLKTPGNKQASMQADEGQLRLHDPVEAELEMKVDTDRIALEAQLYSTIL